MKAKLSIRELILFSGLGTIMFLSKILMEWAPNIHLLGMLTVTYTVVYRTKALIPIYVYVFLNGLYGGFSMWWIPYLYIWTVLWGITMLLPKNMTAKTASVIYPVVCGLHGLAYGTLYAPAQALMFGLSFKATIAWIAAGFPWDILHCVGNIVAGLLIFPMTKVLKKLNKTAKT